MSYLTVNDLKAYLNITESTDDNLLVTLIAAAQKAVESHTRRVFEASADAIRYFTVGVDTDGATLLLDRDLCAITSIITNADSTSPITLATTEYFTKPRNHTPYYEIVIAGSSGQSWRYASDAEAGIKVTGKWAYSLTAPADIVQACRRLAGYAYKQRDAQVFDVTAFPDQGQIIIPKGMPQDVKILLAPYIRVTL